MVNVQRHSTGAASRLAASGHFLQGSNTTGIFPRCAVSSIGERGTSDPQVGTEGTIAYLITLDSGFSVLFRDSGGPVTEHERAVAERVGSVSVMLAPTAAAYLNTLTVEQALEYVRTYQPTVFIPAHHDAAYNNLWRATEPMFQAIADEDPNIVTVSRGYREPVCFDTKASFDRGR